MSINKGLYTSSTCEWATPQKTFDELNLEFNFTLDPCCNSDNKKCEKFFTKEDNGLVQDWGGYTVFCNPPYGKEIKYWVKKCSEEAKKPNTKVVLLMPARTDTIVFHEYIYKKAHEIRFLKGRLKFNDGKNPAPFPSMVIVF